MSFNWCGPEFISGALCFVRSYIIRVTICYWPVVEDLPVFFSTMMILYF